MATKIKYRRIPPICQVCDRYVRQTSIHTIGIKVPCCRDCYIAWYDECPGGSQKPEIKAYVLKKYGISGGEGVEWHGYTRHLFNKARLKVVAVLYQTIKIIQPQQKEPPIRD